MNGDRISFGYMNLISSYESCCVFDDYELNMMHMKIRRIDFDTSVRLSGAL